MSEKKYLTSIEVADIIAKLAETNPNSKVCGYHATIQMLRRSCPLSMLDAYLDEMCGRKFSSEEEVRNYFS